jgi:thiamine biosynthesis lipoprotein
MGTTVSLTCPGLAPGPDGLGGVVAAFTTFDDTFSLYKDRSELSAVARGDLKLTQASPAVKNVYARATGWRTHTAGAFTAHRPDGVVDLNGIVKALAIQAAAEFLHSKKYEDWCLNVGGDVLTFGLQATGAPWTVGIIDPNDRSAILCAVDLRPDRPAIATSGSAERGDHIWAGGDAANTFQQVTVMAETIEIADVLATAIVSGGQNTLDVVTAHFEIDVLTVDRLGALSATPGFLASLAV